MGLRGLWTSVWRRREAPARAIEFTLDAAGRAKLVQVVRLGCPRETAGKYVGLTSEQLAVLVARDDSLQREMLQAEADAEVRHMSNVHKASSDEKNWRTSVWWLERHGVTVPEPGQAASEPPEAILAALEKFAELIVAEIPDVTRRQALLTSLMHIAMDGVEPPVVIDAELPALPTSDNAGNGTRMNAD